MITFFKTYNIRQFKSLIEGLMADFGEPFKETMKAWCKKIDDGKFWQVWIVKKDKEIIGVCGLYSMDFKTKTLWLGWLGILKKHRNKGLGKDIMSILYVEAKNVGATTLNSYVNKEGKPLSFYYREGFQRIGTVSEYLKKKKLKKSEAENFENMEDHIITKKL
jgi:N-acetylglutamate synthase-like GNAT family acetyltransferase